VHGRDRFYFFPSPPQGELDACQASPGRLTRTCRVACSTGVKGRGGVDEAPKSQPKESLTVDSFLAFLRAPALHVAIARDAFVFDISWLGIVLVVGAMLLWRWLKR